MKNTKAFKFYLYSIGVILVGFVLLRPSSHEDQLISVTAKSLPKTVMIAVQIEVPLLRIQLGDLEVYRSTETVMKTYLGSGVIISPNGHILTCAHLFDDGDVRSISIKTYNEYIHAGDLLYMDVKKDLALVRIFDETPQYAKLADPRGLKVGQEVIAIGYPLALDFSVTHGIISYLNRDFKFRYNALQTDTFINPGNSGGPLFNLKGELVGINSFIIPPINAPIFTGCGFSVEAGQIIEFLTNFKKIDASLPKFSWYFWK